MIRERKLVLSCSYALLASAVLLLGLIGAVARAEPSTTAPAEWLEPRGLSIVELVGQVPDEYLQGTIVSYGDWDGILVYESGSRLGNTVVITTAIYPRFTEVAWVPNGQLTMFGCLGQAPLYDHMGSVVPASTLRVYDDLGQERTQDIVILEITTMDGLQPSAGSDEPFRYPEVKYGLNRPNPLPLDENGLHIPTNSGCNINLPGGNYQTLTGVFTLVVEPSATVSLRGTQEATFQSYIGVGWVGIFQPLMDQLRRVYSDRHERIPLSVPIGANYFLLRFPPMPGDAYTGCCAPPYYNADRPSAGTYRLANGFVALSSDLVFSAGFPLASAWRDVDEVPPGTDFLPLLSSPPDLAPPEYVLPQGIPYDPCFTQGNCPASVLDQIYSAEMTLEIIYLRVTKPVQGQWIPVQVAGPGWSSLDPYPLPTHQPDPEPVTDSNLGARDVLTAASSRVFLPLLLDTEAEEIPDNCPCGWFDDLGRMLGFASGP